MDERYKLAEQLFMLSLDLEGEADFEYGATLIEQAVEIICPDFKKRFSAELEEGMEEAGRVMEEMRSAGLDPFSSKPAETPVKADGKNIFDIEKFRKGQTD